MACSSSSNFIFNLWQGLGAEKVGVIAIVLPLCASKCSHVTPLEAAFPGLSQQEKPQTWLGCSSVAQSLGSAIRTAGSACLSGPTAGLGQPWLHIEPGVHRGILSQMTASGAGRADDLGVLLGRVAVGHTGG